jgi:glycine betaine/proline transport system substrate-binding protein
MNAKSWVLGSLAGLAMALALIRPAIADPASCRKVTFGQPPWTDIATTDGMAITVLDALGYQLQAKILSVPVIFQALANGQIDAFLGNWMPAQSKFAASLIAQKKVDRLGANLIGAKYTLAVPDYVAAAGVRSVADLQRFADRFDKRIYGIEPGAPGNLSIERMIDAGEFGLKGWRLVASSEQGMLAEVQRDVARKKWIVFLAWEPHPMNVVYHITYLSGGDKYFGPNYGGATVYTLVRPGLPQACPNLTRFLGQIQFSVPMENQMMVAVEKGKQTGQQAAVAYLKAHPEIITPWLNGVATISGAPAGPAVTKGLGN